MGVFVLLRREALAAQPMPQVVAAGAAVGMHGLAHSPAGDGGGGGRAPGTGAGQAAGPASWKLPALYIGALCLSFLVIANHGQDVADLQNLFTGIDVAVTPERAMAASPVLLTCGLICILLWRRLLMAQPGGNPGDWRACAGPGMPCSSGC